jgi:hypothetical protein
MTPRPRPWRAGLGALLLLGLAGCFNPFDPRIAPTTGVYVPPPTPDSPQGIVRLFAWCWNNRDATTYQQLFTSDYVFVFAVGDSAGNQYRDAPWTREDELNTARNLFEGGGAASPAASITLVLDATLYPSNDSRRGKDPKWHKEVATSVNLAIETEEGIQYNITGNATFYVVRGDSAKIPSDLSLKPDSTRWYIERWEDYTLKSAVTPPPPELAALLRGRAGTAVLRAAAPVAVAADPVPTYAMTWGFLKDIYRAPYRP